METKDLAIEIKQILKEAYAMRGNKLELSIELTEKALQLSREINSELLTAKSLNQLALFNMINTEHESAIDMSKNAIESFTKLGDEVGIANAKYNLAGVYYKTNNYHLGMFYLIDCLNTYRKHNELHNECKTLKALGAVYDLLGDQNGAIKVYGEAIDIAKRLGDEDLESNVYNPLSGIFLKMGQIEMSMDLIEKSIKIKQKTKDTRGYAFAIYGRGKIYLKQKKYTLAEKDFLEACKIHTDFSDSYGTTIAYNKLGLLWKETGETQKAKEILQISVDYSTKAHLDLLRIKACYLLYKIYKEEDNDVNALKYLEQYIDVKDSSTNRQTLMIIENYGRMLEMQSLEKEAKLESTKQEMNAKQLAVEHKSIVRQDFLSAMSHEIRTPLNAVTSIISLLKERSDEDEKKLLTSLQFSSKNLLRIINDILDFSKLDSQKMLLEKHPTDLSKLLNNIIEAYQGLAKDKGLSLNLKMCSDSKGYYQIDETRIFQIIGNLVSNAIKYTNRGKVLLEVEVLQKRGQTNTIQFKITDTGIGISEQDQKRLFESFFMPTSITTRNEDGTGLGLAIVKKLVELHESTIVLESVIDEGSCFYFNLELETATTIIEEDAIIIDSLRNKVAIVAEDNDINALVMRELLKKWDVKFIRARNGNEAVSIANKTKVNFILMDIHMPEMNGFDAAKIIKNSDSINKDTPIFALTADVTAPNNIDYANYFDAFLWKPIQINRLMSALAKVSTTVQ